MIVQNVALEEVLAALCRIVEEQAPRPLRAEISLGPGTPASEATWSVPIVSAGGAVLGAFRTYCFEPHEPQPEEKQLVEVLARTAAVAIERHRADVALRESEARYRALVESSPRQLNEHARMDYAVRVSGIGFWHWDLALDELVWDERVREHFFVSGTQRVTLDDFYARLHPDDREPTRVEVDKAIQQGAHYDTNYRVVDPVSGATRWIRSVGGVQYDADGKLIHFGGVTVDVTRQQMHEANLLELNERLQEQDRRKDEFIATLAHELRNPLAPVRTGLYILKISTDPVQTGQVREMMERQLAHLVRLVDDLLDVSRITLGKVTLKREPVDFRVIVNAALEATRSLVEARRHEITLRLSAQVFPLVADTTRLTQVLANLINNAARYTPSGGSIQIAADEENGQLVVRVSDTGIGMEPELLSHVFEMFVQGEAVTGESQGGLGVGLTLVRRLVEMHGGSVEASSQGRGKGSTFVLRLPLALERAAGAAAGAAAA